MEEDWRQEALCSGDDPNKWFPEERNPVYSPAYKAELQELRSICANCPFQRECLEYALQNPASVEHGVYAGTTGTQRRKILKEMIDTNDIDD